jgi:Fe-S-cluster containining protein
MDAEAVVVDCSGCTAPCCRSFAVWNPSKDGDPEIAESTVRGRFARAGARLRIVDRTPGGYRRYECLALVDARCSVYETRPRVCRTYDCRDDASRYDVPDTNARCAWPRE